MMAAGSLADPRPGATQPHSTDSRLDRGALASPVELGGLFFSSPTVVWRAAPGPAPHLLVRDGLGDAVRMLCETAQAAGSQRPVVFGLVPFDRHQPAYFQAPAARCWWVPPAHQDMGPVTATVAGTVPHMLRPHEFPSQNEYESMVRRAVALIADGVLDKVVLARTLTLTLDTPLNVAALLQGLLRANQQAYVYALPLATSAASDAPAMLVGASPELLVRRHQGRLTVNPLAGSVPRHEDPVRDAAAAAALAVSEKDLREHAFVVDRLRAQLAPLCAELHVPEAPSLVATDRLWHLSTLITATPREPASSALDVALALHPTPAICGSPTATAAQLIRTLEPFDRGYFAGLVGWQDAHGDGEWAIALRCARCEDHTLQLFAGAGVVAGSDPHAEYLETGTKLRTLLDAVLGTQIVQHSESV